jgi:hypothetical protein
MKKFFVFICGVAGFWLGLFFIKIVAPEFSDSRILLWFFTSFIVALATSLNANSEIEYELLRVTKTKKILAILFGSLLGGITALILDIIDLDNDNAFFLAPTVSYIASRIVLESKKLNETEIGIKTSGFFRSKIWLLMQITWVILILMTAKYGSYYPQKVYLFYSFFGREYQTTGLTQVILLALPFSTNIYYWFKKSNN